jgi:excisionase family DNA binding protein
MLVHMHTAVDEREYLSVRQTAELLGVSVGTTRRWLAAGHIPALQPGGRHGALLVRRADIDRALEQTRSR